MAAMQAPAAAGEEGEGSAYLKTPIRPGDRSTASATPATSLPRAHAGEQGEDTGPGQRQEQLALLMRDLQVVLQHGKAMQARLQREGMSRQALALQVRDLERALDDAANARADREEQLLAQIAELEAHVASVREQAGRDDNQRRVQGEEVKALESRVAEHAASAAAAGAEVERLRQTIGQHTSALSALRDEADATERELAALQAARAERERQFGAREAALDSRVAELSEALSQSVRSAEAKGAEASRLSAQLAGALTEASRANAAREAAEASAKELRAALEAADSMPPASRSAPDPAALAAQLDSTRAELGARDEQVRALSAELEAARAEQQQRRDADSEPGSGGAGEPASAERERELRAQLERTAAELSSQSTLVQQLRSECAALRLELEAETNVRLRLCARAAGRCAACATVRAARLTQRAAALRDGAVARSGGEWRSSRRRSAISARRAPAAVTTWRQPVRARAGARAAAGLDRRAAHIARARPRALVHLAPPRRTARRRGGLLLARQDAAHAPLGAQAERGQGDDGG